MTNAPKQTVTIKKYANRRLYNTATSSYVTLENLAAMVKEGIEFNVYDAKTSEDITRSVLTQIIVEEENKSGTNNLLPISFLRQLIGFYGDNMQWMVPKYLEQSMQSLTKNQEQIRTYFQNTFGSMFPFGSTLEQMGKQNIAMFERAMRMFAPFGGVPGSGEAGGEAAAPHDISAESEEAAEDAFTPSMKMEPVKKGEPTNVTAMPTPATTQASTQSGGGEEVQQKIAALQRQLSDLAKTKV